MIFIIGFVILVMIIIFANSGSKKNRTTKNNTTASGVSNIAETVEDDSLTLQSLLSNWPFYKHYWWNNDCYF